MVWKKISTYLILAVNVIFMLFAFAVTALGIFSLLETSKIVDEFEVLENLNEDITLYPTLITVIGFCLILTSMLGCVAAIMKGQVCLTVYIILLGVLMIIQVTGASRLILQRDDILSLLETDANTEWHIADRNDTRKHAQEWLTCCGWNSTIDFPEPLKLPNNTNTTCMDYFMETQNTVISTGCYFQLSEWIRKATIPTATAILSFVAFQGLALAATIYLRIKKNSEERLSSDY